MRYLGGDGRVCAKEDGEGDPAKDVDGAQPPDEAPALHHRNTVEAFLGQREDRLENRRNVLHCRRPLLDVMQQVLDHVLLGGHVASHVNEVWMKEAGEEHDHPGSSEDLLLHPP